jgi:N-acyl-D-aspartate/D-glutamate deacylase
MTSPRRLFLLTLLAASVLPLPAQGAPQDFDVLISGGRIVDGTGNPWFFGDLGLRGGVIAALGDLDGATAPVQIDARGLVVAPGFIDPHVHGSISRGIDAPNFLIQGVTTLITGNDGSSPFPIGSALEEAASNGMSPNVGLYIGHGTVRRDVLGSANRHPNAAELRQMQALVAQAMEEGALGLSTGLAYVPGNYSETEEVIELSRVAARYGGIYISHMRNEGAGVLDSVRETIRIGDEAGIPVQMTHHKVGGMSQFGQSVQSIQMMTEARARGVDITFDQYPYTASATGVTILFPPWALADGQLEDRLQDPETLIRIKAGVLEMVNERLGDDPSRLQFSSLRMDRSMDGKTMADLLRKHGKPLTAEATVDMLIDVQLGGGASGIYHSFDEGDMRRFMQSPYGMIGSDGSIREEEGGRFTHPRAFGAYARVLGRYVRELNVLTLEEAIRKMSSFPARRLGIADRGLLRVGMAADIAVFDPDTIADRSTFTDPTVFAVGMRHVLVNGVLVIDDGVHTGARPGVVLYGPGRR